MTSIARHFYKIVKENKNYHQKDDEEEIDYKVVTAINSLRDEITEHLKIRQEENKLQDNAIKLVTEGVLAVYKPLFMARGKELLKPDHVITPEEYFEYSDDHKLYNELGGNHKGDKMFESVKIKYEAGLQHQ